MVNGEFAGRLAAFGDPVLDALVEQGKAIKDTKRERHRKAPEPARCPSCGRVCTLTRGYVAVLCQECHEDITRLAAGRYW